MLTVFRIEGVFVSDILLLGVVFCKEIFNKCM